MRFFSPARNTAACADFVGRTQDMARRGILAAIVVAAASTFAVSTLAWSDASSAEQLQPAEELQPTEEGLPTEQVLSAGRVVKVDIGAGRITIEHKPISRFHMEAMTRIFRVKDPTMLTALTPGDKIRFRIERGDDGFIVTEIENSN